MAHIKGLFKIPCLLLDQSLPTIRKWIIFEEVLNELKIEN